eukprot:TRINITY_DN8846_c0_g1_i1.p1 TRINITY_DN8846_c0_g1~~TRINITY_DN8846_c0_g1_i1.p1  ORF type:complete len:510 (+),score=119.46 TRINITY_DN8846_c0_g1_i1:233-1762(+)
MASRGLIVLVGLALVLLLSLTTVVSAEAQWPVSDVLVQDGGLDENSDSDTVKVNLDDGEGDEDEDANSVDEPETLGEENPQDEEDEDEPDDRSDDEVVEDYIDDDDSPHWEDHTYHHDLSPSHIRKMAKAVGVGGTGLSLADEETLIKHHSKYGIFKRLHKTFKKFKRENRPVIQHLNKVARKLPKRIIKAAKKVGRMAKVAIVKAAKNEVAFRKKLGQHVQLLHNKLRKVGAKLKARVAAFGKWTGAALNRRTHWVQKLAKNMCVKKRRQGQVKNTRRCQWKIMRKYKDKCDEEKCTRLKTRTARVNCLAHLWEGWATREVKKTPVMKFNGKIENPEDLSIVAPMIRLLGQIMNNPEGQFGIKPLSDSDLDKAGGTDRDALLNQFQAANALSGQNSYGNDPLTDPSLDAIGPSKVEVGPSSTNPLLIMQQGASNAPVMWDSRSITQIIEQMHGAAKQAVDKVMMQAKGLGPGDPDLTRSLMALYPFMQMSDKPEDKISVDDIMRLTQR